MSGVLRLNYCFFICSCFFYWILTLLCLMPSLFVLSLYEPLVHWHFFNFIWFYVIINTFKQVYRSPIMGRFLQKRTKFPIYSVVMEESGNCNIDHMIEIVQDIKCNTLLSHYVHYIVILLCSIHWYLTICIICSW